MTRLLTDGAEFGDLLVPSSYFNVVSIDNTTKRTGRYSYKVGGDNSYITMPFGGNKTEVFVRHAIYREALGSGEAYVAKFMAEGTVLFQFLISNVTNTLRATKTNWEQICAPSQYTIPITTWIVLQYHYLLDSVNGLIEVKIDGLLDPLCTFTGNTKFTSDTTMNGIRFGSPGGSTIYHDDIAINDTVNTDGKGDNSWPGNGYIELLKVNGNSPENYWEDEWTGSDEDQTDNYALVDELPPSGSDYVEASVAGYQDAYAHETFDGSGKLVKRVWTEARALDSAVDGGKIKLGIRLNSADYRSDAISLPGSYVRVVGEEYIENPEEEDTWDEDGVNDSLPLIEFAT